MLADAGRETEGKISWFQHSKKGQHTGLEFLLVWTTSPHLSKLPNENMPCVSSRADGGAACNSDLRLKHPLKKSDFILLPAGSTGGDYTSPRSVGMKYMIFFFPWWFCATGCHFVALCMVVWINTAIMVSKYLRRKKVKLWIFCFLSARNAKVWSFELSHNWSGHSWRK